LGIDTVFPGNKLWSFVDAKHVFTNPENPFPFPSTKSYVSLSNNMLNDFIGVKLGDVTEDWNPLIQQANNYGYTSIQTLNNQNIREKLQLYSDTVVVENDSVFTLKIKSKNLYEILGLQMTFGWDQSQMQFLDVASNQFNGQFNLRFTPQGRISVLWNNEGNAQIRLLSDSTLISFRFKKKLGNQILETFINSDITKAEAYGQNMRILNIEYLSGPVITKTLDVSLDNTTLYPNPNSGYFNLKFSNYLSSELNLYLYTENGVFVGKSNVPFKPFSKEYKLRMREFGNVVPGAYLLKIVYQGQTKSIKIICLSL
jgi:hypothetical protein